MNIFDKFGIISLQKAIELFTPFFIIFHNWNIEDTTDKVKKDKSEFIKNKLLWACRNNKITGKIAEEVVYDFYEEPIICADGYIDTIINCEETTFNLKETVEYIFELIDFNKCSLPFKIVRETNANANNHQTAIPEEALVSKKNDSAKDLSIVDMYIKASVAATVYCVAQGQEISITKEHLAEQLEYDGFKNINSDDIFKYIPESHRHPDKGGPPKKILDIAINEAFYAGTLYAKKPKITFSDLSEAIEKKYGKKARKDIIARIYTCVQEDPEASE